MVDTIFVYSGPGVGERAAVAVPASLVRVLNPSSYRIAPLSAAELLRGAWAEQAALLVLPGGADRPYHELLKGAPNRLIREYVESGGRFLGLCAGGYYGSAKVVFDQGLPTEIVEDRELKFFPGAAIGPAYGFGSYDPFSEQGARAAHLETVWGDCGPVYFNGGCFFEGTERFATVTKLAVYTELPKSPAAIVRCQVGKGTAVLSGVHPEYDRQSFLVDGVAISDVARCISESPFQVQLFARILSELGIQVVGNSVPRHGVLPDQNSSV